MSDSSRPAALSAAVAFGRATGGPSVKSPSKSPVRAPASMVMTRVSVDDVSYRQTDSSSRAATDQARVPEEPPRQDGAAEATEQQSKYMRLLSTMYSQHANSKAHSPAAAAGALRAPVAPAAADPAAAASGPTPPPQRTSGSPKDGQAAVLSSKGSSSTPTLRRSKASILDSSPAASCIPGGLVEGAAAAASNSRPHGLLPVAAGGMGGRGMAAGPTPGSPTPAYGMRSSFGASNPSSRILAAREPASPMRRSAPTAQPRPHYAFGSRVDSPAAAAAAKARPTRAGPPAATAGAAAAAGSPNNSLTQQQQQGYRMRAAASPQRVPPAARASAPAANSSAAYMRSASAPRMSSAEKAQSRFTQHALSAAAALRSKTPNPAQRAAAAAAAASAAAGNAASGSPAARRLRPSAQSQTAASERHIARMRASEAAAAAQHGHVPGFGLSSSTGTRSPTKAPAAFGGPPSPISRAGARSVQAAGNSRALPAPPGGRSSNRPAGQRLGLSMPAAAGSSPQDSAAAAASGVGLMMPVIRDRYKDLYKHTPASIAVQEAQAAAAEQGKPRGLGVSAPVPKLALGGLSKQRPEDGLAAPRGPSQQQQQAAAEEAGGSAFLGRISGLAAAPADQGTVSSSSSSAAKQQPQGSFTTPQRKPAVPLLALSTLTPAAKSRPAASGAAAAREASPCTPASATGSAASAAKDEARSCDIDLTPCPASAPEADETPSLLMKQQPRTGGSSSKAQGGPAADADEANSPQLAPRDLSSGMTAAAADPAAAQAVQQGSSGSKTLSREGSGGAAAAAAKGLLLPALQLPGVGGPAGDFFDSPPKHRRGERESPTNESAENVKTRAHNACAASSGSSNSYNRSAATPPAKAPAAAAASRSGPSSASKASAQAAAKAKPRVAVAAMGGSSVLQAAAEGGSRGVSRDKQGGLRGINSTGSLPSPGAGTPTHAGSRPHLDGTPSSSGPGKGMGMGLPSPSKKLGTPVPRLDLTPVLASLTADNDSPGDPGSHSHAGPLLLEDAPRPRRLDMDAEADEGEAGAAEGLQRTSSSSGKAQGGPGSSKGASGSSKSHGLSSKTCDAPSSQSGAEAAAQESFYVYESVMPPEEQRTYEELRRVLLRAPGGAKHAAHLQGIWGCYQDARRNTEAMAFRGHRLLDQVSTEYSHFKQEAEERLEQLQEERDTAREELQLAMVAGSVPATALQLAAKDRQVAELQQENSLLRQQITEMERALQMASDYHTAHKEQQVPVHARVIAGSATTSILTSQVVAQQYELQQVEKRMEDMKAALHLACGVLRQTNYMDTHGGLREQLDPDTQAVLDSIMATEEMEAAALQQQQQDEGHIAAETQQPASPTVHIEEVQEGDGCSS